jgi:hypothetical protein
MALPLFPVSPLPADLGRTWDWGESSAKYDTGARQASTAYTKPLYSYQVPIPVMNEFKESSLYQFVDGRRGMTDPFFVKDPYVYGVNSVLAVRSGITNAATLYVYDTRSFTIHPDTTTIGSLFSSLSGYVRLGVEYAIDQDSGILTVNTKAVTDVWGARSFEYFRKMYLDAPYSETAKLWNLFGTTLTLKEMP